MCQRFACATPHIQTLISLSAFDEGGIHHETAHTACSVLADFPPDGFFSLARDGPAVNFGLDDILFESDYYFRFPGMPDYDVVANFGSSEFKYNKSLRPWTSETLEIPEATGQPRETTCSGVVLSRDVSCRLTQSTHGTQVAHLLPKSEELWYTPNSMFQYSAWEEKGTPDDPRNTILLRSDVHTIFDARRLAKWRMGHACFTWNSTGRNCGLLSQRSSTTS